MIKLRALIPASLGLLLLPLAAQAGFKDGKLDCSVLRTIPQVFLTHHFDARTLDLEHEGRTIERFLKILDPQKIYLLESDAMKVRANLRGIFARLGDDCSAIDASQKILVQRLQEAAEFAKKTLGPNFKFDETTELVFDPNLRKFPATRAEADQQLTRFIQFQVSNYLASDMKLPKAKKQLVHRYELNAKRQAELKRDELYAEFLDAFATALDAHSSYLAPDALEDFEIQMRLSLEGIGAALTWDDGYTTVESLIPGGSAERSGELEPKDKIVAVAQGDAAFENVIDMPLRDVVKLIRGKKGTTVRLTVIRQKANITSHKIITLVRDKIKLEDEAAQLRWQNVPGDPKTGSRPVKVAILELPSFYGDLTRHTRSCYEDVRKLLEKADAEKADAVVFDLSGNGGGLLTEAVRIGGLFIKKGNIVATLDAHSPPDKLADDDDSVVWKGPLVVLTSRLSASASEIVAGALQDYHRAVIVGADHTFGKGTVQAMMNVPSNLGAIKVTTGMFFVPGGESTQFRGVPGDIVIPSPFSVKDIGEEALDNPEPKKSIDPFLSPEANDDGPTHWNPVTPSIISALKEKSSERVSKDAEFKKIAQELADTEKKKGVIKLAESLKKQKDEKNDPKNKAKEKQAKHGKRKTDEDYLKMPNVAEAVAVAADLYRMTAPAGAVAQAPDKSQNANAQ